MKHYTFEEVQIGLTESFTVLITDDQMKTFTGLSGDLNPMHTDAEYAKSKGFYNIPPRPYVIHLHSIYDFSAVCFLWIFICLSGRRLYTIS